MNGPNNILYSLAVRGKKEKISYGLQGRLIGDFSHFYTSCYVDIKIFSIPITIETAAIFPTPRIGPPRPPHRPMQDTETLDYQPPC